METFIKFVNANTCKETLTAFRELRTEIGIVDNSKERFIDQLASRLKPRWKEKQLLQKLQKRFSSEDNTKHKSKVLVVGCGPCGLRTAIEATLMGYKAVLIDKRTNFSRNNVLHLWPYLMTDLRNLEIKYFYGQFGCGDLNHISIRRLQISLLKIALVVGVEVFTNIEFQGLIQPEYGSRWKALCKPMNEKLSNYQFEVLIGATGSRDALCDIDVYNSKQEKMSSCKAFERKEREGKLAIAITANFVNNNTRQELKAHELGGISSHFQQEKFKKLREKYHIDLENIVYYRDETHYFVMTAKKASLLKRRVFKRDFTDTSDLMARANIDVPALLSYAKDAANFCTDNELPDLKFALNKDAKEDVSMLDFSSKYEAINASRVIIRDKCPLLIGLVGDSLLEPFWPTGTGCARGFLGAFDAVWMMKQWSSHPDSIVDVIVERESIYKLLSQTTTENIKKKYSDFTIDPSTRYNYYNPKAITASQARCYLDETDASSAEIPGVPTKRLKKDDDDLDLKSRILTWCRESLSRCTDIRVTDLTTSWRDGYALCALVHTYRPNLINIHQINRREARKNVEFVVKLAQREFGISPMMTVSQILLCSSLNEIAMTAYLNQFYIQFQGEYPPISDHAQYTHPILEEVTTGDGVHVSEQFLAGNGNQDDLCYFCGKKLYMAEKMYAEGILFHQKCLKCHRCGCMLYSKTYRARKTAIGKVTFYCERHAHPRSNFASSVRKRQFAVRNESRMDKITAGEVHDNRYKPMVPNKPDLPRKPDFLAGRVATISRRTEFYNSPDEVNPQGDSDEEESEKKVFEHNFGESIRRGVGAFSIVKSVDYKLADKDEDVSKEESSADDMDIEEALQDSFGDNVDKNMTIKDAKTLWQTLKTKTKAFEALLHGKDKGPSDSTNENSSSDSEKEEDLTSTLRATGSTSTPDSVRISKNLEQFEAAATHLDDEMKDLLNDSDTRGWTTVYRPEKTQDTKHATKKKMAFRRQIRRQHSDVSDIRQAQRIQCAARKLAREREQNKVFEAQELQLQLEEAEMKRQEIEARGIEIEHKLEDGEQSKTEEETSTLKRELFTLSVRRQELLKYESDLHNYSVQFEDLGTFDELPEMESLNMDDDDNDDDDDDDEILPGKIRSRNISIEVPIKSKPETETKDVTVTNDNDKQSRDSGILQKSTSKAEGVSRTTWYVTPETELGKDHYGDIESPDLNNTLIGNKRTMDLEGDELERTIKPGDFVHIEHKDLPVDVLSESCLSQSGDGYINTAPDDITTALDTWECAFCTLINGDYLDFCDVCEAWKCSMCTYVNESWRKRCEMCSNKVPKKPDRHVNLHHHTGDSAV